MKYIWPTNSKLDMEESANSGKEKGGRGRDKQLEE